MDSETDARRDAGIGATLKYYLKGELEDEVLKLHDVGNNKTIAGLRALAIRGRCNHHHVDLMARIVTRLKSVPEGKDTMCDNTTVPTMFCPRWSSASRSNTSLVSGSRRDKYHHNGNSERFMEAGNAPGSAMAELLRK